MGSLVRLNTAIEWLNENDTLADVGCDHGYLAIMALNKGLKYVQLIDNKNGPLDVAKNNIRQAGLIDFVSFSLSDGISNLDKRVNSISIMGMGGELITRILDNNTADLTNIDKIILEPNTKIPLVRKYLNDHNFQIMDEKIVWENSFYYELILCKKVPNVDKLTEDEILLGPIQSKNKNHLFIEKWSNIYQKYQAILNNEKFINKTNDKNYQRIKQESEIIKKYL